MDDLVARCQEIIDWHKTGILVDGRLREFAKTMPHAEEHQRLRGAEGRTAEDAMKFVINHKD